MNLPLQQTNFWQDFQNDLKTPESKGQTTFFEKGKGFQYLAIKKSTPVGSYLYLPYGPYTHDKNGAQNAKKALQKLAESVSAIFVRIEPQTSPASSYRLKTLSSAKSTKSSKKPKSKAQKPAKIIKTHDLNPADTWVLDLTAKKEDIISNFSQGTRTRYNNFTKKGLTVETSKNPNDIKYLVDLQQKLAKTKKIATFSPEYLKTELKQPFATLYLVHYNPQNVQNPVTNSKTAQSPSKTSPSEKTAKNKKNAKKPENEDHIIAASLFFDDDTTRYYMQSAADADYKKLPATVALLTTALFDAKEKGLKNFDFWGIAPDGAGKDHPWAGFTEFKKSFGGSAKHYSGTHDIILRPFKYRLYQFLRKLNRLKRKLKH